MQGGILQPLNLTTTKGSDACTKCHAKRERNTKFIDLYFVERNGHKFKPIDGVNYNIETLSYMTSASQADRITKTIIDNFPGHLTKNITVVECCSGLGGDTVSFLDNKHINKVIAHEIIPERRQFLKANLDGYKFPSDKYEIRGAFEGILPEWKGAVVYFDPPWIKQNTDQTLCTCDDVVLDRGITISGKTLEQWMETIRDSVSMIVMKLPPKYQLNTVPGYKCRFELNQNKNVKTVICIPDNGDIVQLVPGAKLSQTQPKIGKIQKEFQTQQKQTMTQEPQQGPGLKTQEPSTQRRQTVGGNPDPKLFITDSQKWLEGLQMYIYTVITPMVFPGDTKSALNKRSILVDQKAMDIWTVAFTHKSYKPTTGQNYEVLEHLGDKALGLAFDKYLISKFKNITEKELSELHSVYMSKIFQADKAAELGATKWVRVLVDRSKHVKEDLFESIFGALMQIGDSNFPPGTGYTLAYNTLVNMFQGKIEIDFRLAEGRPKTQLKQMAEKMGWIKSGDISQMGSSVRVNEGFRLQIKLTPEAFQEIRAVFKVPIKSDVIADITSTSTLAVEDKAYVEALQTLASYGITYGWIEQVAENRKMTKGELAPYWPGALERMQKEGFTSLEFSKPRKGTHTTYVQLIGVNTDKTKVILITVDEIANTPNILMRQNALKKYSQQGRDIID